MAFQVAFVFVATFQHILLVCATITGLNITLNFKHYL